MSTGPLTATELALVVGELSTDLHGCHIDDVARLSGGDDLLLFVSAQGQRRRALHVALGAGRARICTTRRRFGKAAFATGPQLDRLRELLVGCTVDSLRAPPDERRVTIACTRDGVTGPTLDVELFGNRGLWILSDADGHIAELSRLPDGAGQKLRRGETYAAPPPPGPGARPRDAKPRFAPPYASAIDAHFTALDLAAESDEELDVLRRAAAKAAKRQQHRVDGLARQRDSMVGAAELRSRADLLLAYGHGAPRGATELRVPDPADPDGEITLTLDPALPVHAQAARLYDKARRYADGLATTEARLANATRELSELTAISTRLTDDAPTDDELKTVRAALARLGALPAAPASAPKANRSKIDKQVQREGFRRYVSSEGLPIFVGRNNAQNDRLSVHVARGNDLWFHVGRGYAGSHVVIRLAKNQNASLESLLDAATLAVHFSKIRGAELCEVIYTRAKNVSKPKGLPPGRVVATGTKALRIRLQPERLARLLDASQPSSA